MSRFGILLTVMLTEQLWVLKLRWSAISRVTGGNCSSLTCAKTTSSCRQNVGRGLTCEADACMQSCFREECRLTCPLAGVNCTQETKESSTDMKCDKRMRAAMFVRVIMQHELFIKCNTRTLPTGVQFWHV